MCRFRDELYLLVTDVGYYDQPVIANRPSPSPSPAYSCTPAARTPFPFPTVFPLLHARTHSTFLSPLLYVTLQAHTDEDRDIL
jgi:hypothetical protein